MKIKVLVPVFISLLIIIILLLFNQKSVSEHKETISEVWCEREFVPRGPAVQITTCNITTSTKKTFTANKINGVYKKGEHIIVIESKNVFTGKVSYKIRPLSPQSSSIYK